MNPRWNFPGNNYTVRNGISDSGIETFKGRIERSLAREICQNSLDASFNDQRVRLEFELHEIASQDFPGKKDFLNVLFKAKKSWSTQKDTKTIDFLDEAISVLKSNTMKVLRISDFNTTGLTGSDQPDNSNWMNLIKASGSSDKSSTSGGSYGIGKFATFAASYLRTVFYSTLDVKGLSATQGVAKLVSFNVDDLSDELTQGIGFFGEPDKNKHLPEYRSYVYDYSREQVGTDIFIPGFIAQKDWEELIIIEILESFLKAVFEGTLEAKVGHYSINKENLNEFFKRHRSLIENKSSDLMPQYIAMTSDKTEWFNYDFLEKDDVRIGILVDDEDAGNSKVAMIRRPWMKIYDYRPNTSSYLTFSGICLIEGDGLNELLRKAENPQHTQWDPDRIETNSNLRKIAKKNIRDIKKQIVNQINTLISRDTEDKSDIEGLSDYLPMRESGDEERIASNFGNNYSIKKVTTRTIPSTKTLSEKKEEFETEELFKGGLVEGDDLLVNTNHGHGQSTTGNRGDSSMGLDSSGDKLYPIPQKTGNYELRLFSPTGNHNHLKLVFDNKNLGDFISIKFFKLDEEGKRDKINLVSAIYNNQSMRLNDSMIEKIPLKKGISSIDLNFDEGIPFTAEVKLYETKK